MSRAQMVYLDSNDRPERGPMQPIAITSETLNFDLLAKGQGHKFDHGHAVVMTGGAGRTGAARLSGRAALRIGAGLVTLAVLPAAQMEVAMQITALMLSRVAGPEELAELASDKRIGAICIGPGLGLKPAQAALVKAVLDSGKPCVLDADALTLIAQDPELWKRLGPHCVLTPHGGEFKRLFKGLTDDDATKVQQCLTSAQKAGAVVLYKGAMTVIAHPDGRVATHDSTADRAAPWLATAGAGDVLSGMITGLLARGFAPFEAAQYATWLHVEAARRFGPGLIAEDLIEEIPHVFAALNL